MRFTFIKIKQECLNIEDKIDGVRYILSGYRLLNRLNRLKNNKKIRNSIFRLYSIRILK